MRRELFLLLSPVLLAISSQAAEVCNDPAFIMKPDSDVLRLQQVFNSGARARRVFDEVHYIVPGDPNLTVGMGHWVGSKLAGLFHRLRQDPATWDELTKTWAGSMDSRMWQAFERDTNQSGRDAAAVSEGLDMLLCAERASSTCVRRTLLPWSHRTKDGFNSKKHWFHAGWRSVARLPRVATHQVEHWADSVVSDGQSNAAKRDVMTKGGIATIVSATSSGIGATMFKPGADMVAVSAKGHMLRQPLNKVPAAARPSRQVDEQALLDDWRSLVAWQFYNIKKGKKKDRVRSRMVEIWKLYYEPTWGPLPRRPTLADVVADRRHSGCYMASGPLDSAAPVEIPDPLDCSRSLPSPQPAACR